VDSSAIVKRYVAEKGSEVVRDIFRRAYAGDQTLVYSIWNVGEVLGAMDRAARTKILRTKDYEIARDRFIAETRRMAKRGMAYVIPVRSTIMTDAWRILESRHLYEADALQLATARYAGAETILTGDTALHEAAEESGLRSTLLGR